MKIDSRMIDGRRFLDRDDLIKALREVEGWTEATFRPGIVFVAEMLKDLTGPERLPALELFTPSPSVFTPPLRVDPPAR